MKPAKHVLAISVETDSNVLSSKLLDAKSNTDLSEVAFHAVAFDALAIKALNELLLHDDRDWKKVEFINCTGEVENATAMAMSTDRLEALHIVRNLESFNWSQRLGSLMAGTTKLKQLRVTTALRELDMKSFSQGLASSKSLQEVDFRWCTFEGGSVSHLAKGLRDNRGLHVVDFFGCSLSDDEVAQIIVSLQHHPTLQHLLMNGNKCSRVASSAIATALMQQNTKLSRVDISFQRHEGAERLDITSLTHALTNNTSLHTLDLTYSGLDDIDAAKIAEAMKHNVTLKELYMARNRITDHGIKLIARNLPKMKGLKKLSLWGNPFGEEGARELLDGVSRNMDLCDLHLFRKFDCSDKIQYFTNINRGGRKLLQESPNTIPMSLWPFVLARANHMKIPPRRKKPEFEKARVDMLYCFLRGPVLFSRGFDDIC